MTRDDLPIPSQSISKHRVVVYTCQHLARDTIKPITIYPCMQISCRTHPPHQRSQRSWYAGQGVSGHGKLAVHMVWCFLDMPYLRMTYTNVCVKKQSVSDFCRSRSSSKVRGCVSRSCNRSGRSTKYRSVILVVYFAVKSLIKGIRCTGRKIVTVCWSYQKMQWLLGSWHTFLPLLPTASTTVPTLSHLCWPSRI